MSRGNGTTKRSPESPPRSREPPAAGWSTRRPIGQPFEGRTALLSPFDRLIHDRVRAQELFDFEYYLEMYKPKDKRRWGYFALPVLHNDQLVGKLDAIVDRKAKVLRVDAIHEDVRFTRAITKAVNAEIEALAAWLGVDLTS